MKAVIKRGITKVDLALEGFYPVDLTFFIKKIDDELEIIANFDTRELFCLDFFDGIKTLDLTPSRYRGLNNELDNIIEWVVC